MTNQDLDLDRLEALANQKRGRGYHEEQILIGAVPALIAEVRRLRARLNAERARIWEEGYSIGADLHLHSSRHINPYRKDTK